MKKNVLALSIAAMLSDMRHEDQAHHETDNTELVPLPSGPNPGSLLVPYFTSCMTVFNLTNTGHVIGKPVQVRFRTAPNHDDILDFREFLSPEDSWTHDLYGITGVANAQT